MSPQQSLSEPRKIALFGRDIRPDFLPRLQQLIDALSPHTRQLFVYEGMLRQISGLIRFKAEYIAFNDSAPLPADTFCLISIGGDGTLLDTITMIQDSGIPVLGINTGRLGFLSAVSSDEISLAVSALIKGHFSIEKRSLIALDAPQHLFGEINYALNELSVLKRDNSSMISIQAYIDDLYLNTYWADGLIVATPTGSTGYSMSCGGPIISPLSKTLIITPIASHNLSVRPIIIPDCSQIKLRISGRTQEFLVALDSRAKPLSTSVELLLRKAKFSIRLICLNEKDFYSNIRNKLAWGLDKRN